MPKSYVQLELNFMGIEENDLNSYFSIFLPFFPFFLLFLKKFFNFNT